MQLDRAEAIDRWTSVNVALGGVVDPELDEGLIDLGFVDDVEIAGESVNVTLRLPTYWCSANFAYIMGEDIKSAVGDLPWVSAVEVRLVDHFAMEKINKGLSEDLSFETVFGDEAGGDLDQIRRDFRVKAYLGRQAAVLQLLRRQKLAPSVIVGMSIAALERFAAAGGGDLPVQVARYLKARRAREVPSGADDLAFLDVDDRAIPVGGLLNHLRAVRRVRGSLEANAEMCRILHAARYGPQAAPFAATNGHRATSPG